MPVLRTRKIWNRPRHGQTFDLTAQEQLRVKDALRLMRDRLGSWREVANRLGCARETAKRAARPGNTNGKRPSAGMALALARAAGVPVEELLSGEWHVSAQNPGSSDRVDGRISLTHQSTLQRSSDNA